MRKLIAALALITAASWHPAGASQFTLSGSTWVVISTSIWTYPLAVHFTGPTTQQIHTEVTNKVPTLTVLETLITTGSKYGVSLQLTRGVSKGVQMANTENVYPMSTLDCVAVVFWVYYDTYSATASQEAFLWGMSQTGGGACFGIMGDGDDTNAAQNGFPGCYYNPNGTGYNKFEGSRYKCLPNQWHHVIQVMSRWGQYTKQFVDGKKDIDYNGAGEEAGWGWLAAPTNPPTNFTIGSYAAVANTIQGRLDDFLVIKTSSRTFTDSECKKWYRDAVDRRRRNKIF